MLLANSTRFVGSSSGSRSNEITTSFPDPCNSLPLSRHMTARLCNTPGQCAQFHLLGTVGFERCLELQQRLVDEVDCRGNRQIHVLLCEHSPLISVGRSGSRGHIRLSNRELASRKLVVRWIGRGGGCVAHAPGQLAIYPIVPLARCGWSVGQYMQRLNRALLQVVDQLRFRADIRPGRFGVWGRSGQLAALAVAIRHGVTCHGAFLNVNPPMDLVRSVDVATPRFGEPIRRRAMSCLLAEHGRPVRMTTVRSAVIEQLAVALDCPQYHLHTGHSLLASSRRLEGPHRALAS